MSSRRCVLTSPELGKSLRGDGRILFRPLPARFHCTSTLAIPFLSLLAMVIGITAAIGFTVSLLFATAAFPGGGPGRNEDGALLSFGAAPLALVASRLLRARAT